jgi:hypothetical protein
MEEEINIYNSQPKRLTLGLNIATIFVIWGVGLVISALFLLAEVIRSSFWRIIGKIEF